MSQKHSTFGLALVDSAVSAARNLRSNSGTLGADYPRYSMKTCHEEQRKVRQGEKKLDAEMVADLEIQRDSYRMTAVAVGFVSQMARKVLEPVQLALEVLAEFRIG